MDRTKLMKLSAALSAAFPLLGGSSAEIASKLGISPLAIEDPETTFDVLADGAAENCDAEKRALAQVLIDAGLCVLARLLTALQSVDETATGCFSQQDPTPAARGRIALRTFITERRIRSERKETRWSEFVKIRTLARDLGFNVLGSDPKEYELLYSLLVPDFQSTLADTINTTTAPPTNGA
jgi:hypothetical protein